MTTGAITLDHPAHVPVRSLSPFELDKAMILYLPASPAELRKILEEKIGGSADFSDVRTVSELLIFIASYDSVSR